MATTRQESWDTGGLTFGQPTVGMSGAEVGCDRFSNLLSSLGMCGTLLELYPFLPINSNYNIKYFY